MTPEERVVGVPTTTMAALVLAVFTVSVGYGVILPLLPSLIERLLDTDSPELVSRHTGLLTAVYALALFVVAPAWGWLSDRRGHRDALLLGLAGFSVATTVFSLVDGITAIYVQRFLSGTFAAAAVPVASATVADLTPVGVGRGRRLALVSMASVAGFLIGPSLGILLTRVGETLLGVGSRAESITVPLASMGIIAGLVTVLVAFAVPRGRRADSPRGLPDRGSRADPVINRLLVLTLIVSTGIGAFEVGLALRGTQELHLTPDLIALMFTECSLVMLAAQGLAFSPWIPADSTRRLIPPAFLLLAGGLVLVPWADGFWFMVAAIGGVAASAGVLSPILTYWVSARAGSSHGWELGKQTAAASLGITAGSAAGGLLFNVGGMTGTSFFAAAGLVGVGVLLAVGLPRALGGDPAS